MSSGTMCTSARSDVATPDAAQRVFQNGFLLQQIGLRNHQILPRRIELRLRARDFDLGQSADPDLLLIVLQQLLRGGDFLLPRFHILIEADQIPIEIQSGSDCGDHLLFELQVGGFHVVFLHPDIAACSRPSRNRSADSA